MRVSSIRALCAVALMVATAGIAPTVAAQQRLSVKREDGRMTPLMVYPAFEPKTSCAPVTIISHGAGGSERGYTYLAQALAQDGYTAIVMGHRESGMASLRKDMRAKGIRRGVEALVKDPDAEQDRLLDVGAALKWADSQCKAPFRVLLGHSMGAITVMLEAGAKNMIGVNSPPAGRDRFDAYVALSPEGPGIVFPEHAWSGIRKPMLILTGTRDQSLKGGPQARQVPWQELPGLKSKCQWMGVIDGATHMNFAGSGFGAERVDGMVTQTIPAFLDGVRAKRCVLPSATEGMELLAK